VAVLTTAPTSADIAALDRMHRLFVDRHPDWDDRVDTIYVSAESVTAPGRPAAPLAVVSPGEPFHVTVADSKWMMNWYLVRETGRTLHGPDPSTIIAPIPAARFVADVQQHVQEWRTWIDGMRGRRAYAYAILTLCRALYSYRTGQSTSKSEAAAWTRAQLPEWSDLIDDALRWRLARGTDERDRDDEAARERTRAFVAQVIGLIPPPQHRGDRSRAEGDPPPA
jgi:hypothetical protein